MGLFDKKKNDISFPKKNEEVTPAFPEPPESLDDLSSIKSSVEEKVIEPNHNMNMENKMEEQVLNNNEFIQPPKQEESSFKSSIQNKNPILYIKLSEYKEVVQATNKMRKDIGKAKEIVSELRMIEKDEHSKLEKSEEIIKEVEDIISLFEKVMVTPIE